MKRRLPITLALVAVLGMLAPPNTYAESAVAAFATVDADDEFVADYYCHMELQGWGAPMSPQTWVVVYGHEDGVATSGFGYAGAYEYYPREWRCYVGVEYFIP